MKRTVSRSHRLQDHAPLDYENIGSAIVYRCVHYAWPCMSGLTIVTKIGRRAATTEILHVRVCVYVRGEKRKNYTICFPPLQPGQRYSVGLLARERFNDTALEIFRLLKHTLSFILIFIIIAHESFRYDI